MLAVSAGILYKSYQPLLSWLSSRGVGLSVESRRWIVRTAGDGCGFIQAFERNREID